MSGLRIAIVGGGSVGLALAAGLTEGGAHVTLLVREPTEGILRAEGIRVTGVLGEHRAAPGSFAVDDTARPGEAALGSDILIVTTKAYDVAQALRPFAASAPPALLLMQNGWGSADAARAVMPPPTAIFSSIVMTGLEKLGAGRVRLNGHLGPIQVGSLSGDDPGAVVPMIEAAARGFWPMAWQPHVRDAILAKMLFNGCVNPTGALTGLTYGELLTIEPSRALTIELADEILRVFAAAHGYRPFASGRDYVERGLVPLVIPAGARHRSSMLQDIEAGRRSEIAYLNGAVIDMGRAYGVATPCNSTIVALILTREQAAVKAPA